MEENNNDDNNKIIIIKRNSSSSSSSRKRFIRWVLERGVRLGKNVIMTAVVASSAPLVLPPLIAISAVGFVVWVPAGVVVAGYAAVEKLMTTLLPLPHVPSPTTAAAADDDDDEREDIIHGDDDDDEGECEKEKDAIDVYENLEKKGYEEEYNGGKCIEGEEGDTKGITTCVHSKEEYNVEGIIGKNLEEGECGGGDKGVNLEEDVDDEHLEGEREKIPVNGDSIEEESYMDETGRATAYESTLSAEEGNAVGEQQDSRGSHALERSSDIETKESADEPSTEVMAMMSEEKIWVDIDDDQYLGREHIVEGVNVEHCECMDGEGKVIAIDENVEEYLESEHGDEEEVTIDESLRKGCYVEEVGEYLKGEDEEDNRTENLESKGCVEEKNVINVYENLEKKGYVDDGGERFEGEHGDTKEITTCENLKEEYNVVDDKDVNSEEDVDEEKQCLKEEEEEGYMEEVDDHLDRDDDEEYLENVSTPLESGPKEVSDGMDSECSSIYYTCTLSAVEGNAGEQEDSLGSHASERCSDIKTEECADEPSTEVMGIMSEEKIWEQVSAIRAILGYRDATQPSTVDEIKALFVFIGVEPPSPFDDPSDLTDVYEKLKILMSIVGTK